MSIMANTVNTSLGTSDPNRMLRNNELYHSIHRGIGEFNHLKRTTLFKSAIGVLEGLLVLVAITLLFGTLINGSFGKLAGVNAIVFPSLIGVSFLGIYGFLALISLTKWFGLITIHEMQQSSLMCFVVTMIIASANCIHSLSFNLKATIILAMIIVISLVSQQTNPSKRWVLYIVRGAAAAVLSNYRNIVASGLGIIIIIITFLDVFDSFAKYYIEHHALLYALGFLTWIILWSTRKSNEKSLFTSYQRYLNSLIHYPVKGNGTFADRILFDTWFPMCVANISILHNGHYQHASISPIGVELPNDLLYRWDNVKGDQLRTYRGAMALSGAAIDVGITKSRVFRYLLTTFGVNTGLWLRTKKEMLLTDGPFRIRDLMLTFDDEFSTNKTRFARASDGGHFENTGIYYLLKLRTKTIFSFDASYDPIDTGEVLRVLIAKARRHLNTQIQLIKEADGIQEFAIVYPDMQTGRLYYAKHSRVSLPAKNWGKDVSADFPHDSTANQFLSPDLFDSYYELGLYAAKKMNQFFPV